jgi:hypothetical protein
MCVHHYMIETRPDTDGKCQGVCTLCGEEKPHYGIPEVIPRIGKQVRCGGFVTTGQLGGIWIPKRVFKYQNHGLVLA